MGKANSDMRWHQRLSSFQKALTKLKEAINLAEQRPLSDPEKQGIIQGFEFTHEMARKTMQDLFKEQGVGPILGSRDATRGTFQAGLIPEGDIWMAMIISRN